MITEQRPQVASGDVIVVDGRRVGEHSRTGEILEVVGPREHPHYRVRWDDGHETFLYPGSDTRIRRADVPPAIDAAATRALVELLRDEDVEFELLPHRRTLTAAAEARALGVLPQETAKTIVASADGHVVRAVLPASRRVDLARLAEAVGAPEARLLTENELRAAYPQFELGAVPPFGGRDDDVVVDADLAACDYLVLEAGVHDTSLRLRAEDLVRIADAKLAAISR